MAKMVFRLARERADTEGGMEQHALPVARFGWAGRARSGQEGTGKALALGCTQQRACSKGLRVP